MKRPEQKEDLERCLLCSKPVTDKDITFYSRFHDIMYGWSERQIRLCPTCAEEKKEAIKKDFERPINITPK